MCWSFGGFYHQFTASVVYSLVSIVIPWGAVVLRQCDDEKYEMYVMW